ncbi:MAG: deoxyribodipyrimidine photo-lyase, partial [Vicingaceae bacterium]
QTINIVWLKRDIRSQDHEPLLRAERAGIPYRIVYLFEPSLIEYPDTSLRHLQFVYHSIIALNKTLAPFNRSVTIFYGEAIDVFQYLVADFDVKTIFSFRESGTQITWQRDKKINRLCKQHHIEWQESQRDGVLRGIKNRYDWSKQWHQSMHRSVLQNNYSIAQEEPLLHCFLLPEKLTVQLNAYP